MALLEHVDADITVAVFNAKHRFDRARPSQLEPRLTPSIPVPAHAAYPSGHALQGYVVARVLALLAPDRRDAFTVLGDSIGREREIAGLHFPSDSAASRALGAALFAKLEDNARFADELAAARSEWPSPPR
jgi:acid phosphatase (class A)